MGLPQTIRCQRQYQKVIHEDRNDDCFIIRDRAIEMISTTAIAIAVREARRDIYDTLRLEPEARESRCEQSFGEK